MAINDKLDNEKIKKAARKKSLKRLTFAAIAAFGFSATGHQVNHNVLHAPDRLLEAVEAGDMERADKFAERILSEKDMLELLQTSITDNNVKVLQALFEAKSGHYDGTMQEKFADEYLSQKIFYEHADTLIPLVIESGNLDIFEYLLNEYDDRLSYKEGQNLTQKILLAVIEDGKIQYAKSLSRFISYEGGDYFGNLYHSTALSILELNNIQPSHIAYIQEIFSEIKMAYKDEIIEGLAERGFIEETAEIIKNTEYSRVYSKNYWRAISPNNRLETLINAALYLELTDDFDLIIAAENIAKYASEDMASDFIAHFSINNEQYISWLLISSATSRDEDLAIVAANSMIEQFGEDRFLRHLRYSVSDGDSVAKFLYNVVSSTRLELSDAAKKEIVTYFSGTLDDNLRIIWDLNDADERAPLSRFETIPRP